MKSILVLAPHYYPETGAAARRITAMAEFLASNGWQVRVITEAPHYPQNRIYEGYGQRDPDVRTEQGVEVVRLNPWMVPKASLLLRLLGEIRFCLRIIPQALQRKADVVLASSPYMFLGQTGLLLARLQGARFVWDVRDLTWLYPKATGKPTYGLDRLIEAVMRWTATKAHALTTATEGLLTYFIHQPSRTMVLPNGVSDDWLDKLMRLQPISTHFDPVVTYAGLIGFPQALGTLIETAKLLPDVQLVLAGEGAERHILEKQAHDSDLCNVHFIGYLSQEGLIEVYKQAAIFVAHLRAHPEFNRAEPSKVWEYMAAGRPVIYAGEGDVARFFLQNELAVTVPPEQPQALAGAIRELLASPEKGRVMAERARTFVDQERRRSRLLERLGRLLEEVAQ